MPPLSAAPSLAPVALLDLLDARASRCRLLNRCHPSARCIEHAARRRSCRCTCDTYVHARMSEICVGGVWRALRNTLDGSCRRRASLLCLPPPKRLTGPCLAQDGQTRRRRAARARRAAPAVSRPYQHRSPPELSPCTCPRSLPSSAWIGLALTYSLPENGTKLVYWGAAMIKMKTNRKCG